MKVGKLLLRDFDKKLQHPLMKLMRSKILSFCCFWEEEEESECFFWVVCGFVGVWGTYIYRVFFVDG